jgi:putative flippase GtrA
MTRMPRLPDAARQFGSFLIAGTLGFLVDVGVLYGALALGAGLAAGRVLSFLVAATATWLFNRRYTFTPADGPLWREWLRYLSVMLVGMLVNMAAYTVTLWLVHEGPWWRPALAVAAGSCAGLLVNFVNAKRFVYTS